MRVDHLDLRERVLHDSDAMQAKPRSRANTASVSS